MGTHFNGGNGDGGGYKSLGPAGNSYGNLVEVIGPSGEKLLVPRDFVKTQTAAPPREQYKSNNVSAQGMQLIGRPDGSVVLAPTFESPNQPKPDKVKSKPKTVADLFLDNGYRPAQETNPYSQTPGHEIRTMYNETGTRPPTDASAGWNQFNHVVNSNSGGPMTWGNLDAPDPYALVNMMGHDYGAKSFEQPTPFSDVRNGVLSELSRQPPPAESQYINPAALADYNRRLR